MKYSVPVFQNLCPKKQVKRPRTAKAVKNTLVESLPIRRKVRFSGAFHLVVPTRRLR